MEIKIDIDMDKIDYGEINKKILEKIDTMDIEKSYNIYSMIENTIHNKVDSAITNDIIRYDGEPTSSTTDLIKSVTRSIITKVVEEKIKEVLDKIPEDEFDKLITDMLPTILISVLSENLKNMISSYYATSDQRINDAVANRINQILNRY